MRQAKVLVVGDFVEDMYTHVRTVRSCPEEASAPVYDVENEWSRVGCAGNVALNLASLANDYWSVTVAGVMSDFVQEYLRAAGVDTIRVVGQRGAHPITKRRIVRDGKIIGRIDSSRVCGPGGWLENVRTSHLLKYDAFVISDYGLGAVTDEVAGVLMSLGKPVFVDSKRRNLSVFRGATVIKLNELEWAEQTSMCASNSSVFVESIPQHCVVTLGSRGCDVRTRAKAPRGGYATDSVLIPGVSVDKVVDVTGCGDTFLSALVYAMVWREADVYRASSFANKVASRAVRSLGPYWPSRTESCDMIDKFFGEEET